MAGREGVHCRGPGVWGGEWLGDAVAKIKLYSVRVGGVEG